MPKVELTMNQWGLVLRAVRRELAALRRVHKLPIDKMGTDAIDEFELLTAEDRIIDMSFNTAKREHVCFIPSPSYIRHEFDLVMGLNEAEDKNGLI